MPKCLVSEMSCVRSARKLGPHLIHGSSGQTESIPCNGNSIGSSVLLTLLLTFCGLTSQKTHRGGLGLSRSVHEEAHPCFPYLVQPSFKGTDTGSIYHPLVQLIPSTNHYVWKKYLQQSRVHRNLTNFLECPLIPLVLSAGVKNSFNFNLDSPLHILKTSMRSCLFLRSSSVYSFKQYNLSSFDFPSILLIIFINLLWTFSVSSLSFL